MTPRVVVGIDGGGGHVSAAALVDGDVVFRGHGGPGNPLAVDMATLEGSYMDALDGCPVPDVIGVCAAGAGSPIGRGILEEVLGRRFPSAVVRVGADYRAVVAAAPGFDMWVIAGTGSVVVSKDGPEFRSSGGRGWLLGDHGSAARLGRGLLEFYVNAPNTIAEGVDVQVAEVAGTSAWLDLVRQAQSGSDPAAFLSGFAPLLTRYAESGKRWAEEVLQGEMGRLARTAADHAGLWRAAVRGPSVCLAGGRGRRRRRGEPSNPAFDPNVGPAPKSPSRRSTRRSAR